VLSPAHVVTHYEYDNLDRALWTRTYASADFTLENGELRAETHNLYDDLGRVYESDTYCVTVTSGIGTAGHYLPTYTWYDLAGNVIKTETGTTGAFQKYSYDGLGRLTVQYTGYDTSESTAELYNPTTGQVTLDLSDDTILGRTKGSELFSTTQFIINSSDPFFHAAARRIVPDRQTAASRSASAHR
jgi:YD repeat-containing protein